MRSSIEGLNQEIEGLVLKNTANNSDADHPVEDKVAYTSLVTVSHEREKLIIKFGILLPRRLLLTSTISPSVFSQYARYREQITPEGHRAPLADLLRATRSVNTQTPATDLPSSSYSSGKSCDNIALSLIDAPFFQFKMRHCLGGN